MPHSKCEICGLPALVYETAIDGGKATAHQFCEEHGEPLMPKIELDPQAAPKAPQRFEILTEAEKRQLALLRRLTRRGE